nr:hypothetical protein [Tanacetum cinerariifolium]
MFEAHISLTRLPMAKEFVDETAGVAQGFGSFAWTMVCYELKERLKVSCSAFQFMTLVAHQVHYEDCCNRAVWS